jgi:hypothetical protein
MTLTGLLDDAALLSFEHQLHLADVLGEHSYSVDLGAQRFEFTGTRPRACTGVHLLGTASPGAGSWLWIWANPASYPGPLLAAARFARDFGQRHDITELSQAEVPFSQLPGAPGEPYQAAAIMTEAAKAACGLWTGYSLDAGGGTRASFLVEHPDFQLPPPEPARVARVLSQGLAELSLTDHWRALHSYAQRRPLGVRAAPDRSRLVLTVRGSGLTVDFDPRGRVASVRGTLGPPG